MIVLDVGVIKRATVLRIHFGFWVHSFLLLSVIITYATCLLGCWVVVGSVLQIIKISVATGTTVTKQVAGTEDKPFTPSRLLPRKYQAKTQDTSRTFPVMVYIRRGGGTEHRLNSPLRPYLHFSCFFFPPVWGCCIYVLYVKFLLAKNSFSFSS